MAGSSLHHQLPHHVPLNQQCVPLTVVAAWQAGQLLLNLLEGEILTQPLLWVCCRVGEER